MEIWHSLDFKARASCPRTFVLVLGREKIGHMDEPIASALVRASERYSRRLDIRAGIQLIPWIGSALDTLLAGEGTRIGQKRVDDFLNGLQERLQQVEGAQDIPPGEEFFDLMMQAFDAVLRTRSEAKRRRFATLVANQVQRQTPWEEAEAALQIVSELSDAHICILVAALHAPPCGGVFGGLRVITTEERPIGEGQAGSPAQITGLVHGYGLSALRLICSQLVARGLLHDEGVGRMGTKAMQYFVVTPTAHWLIDWIKESNEPGVEKGLSTNPSM